MNRVDIISNYKLMKALLKNKLYDDLEKVIDETLDELKVKRPSEKADYDD